MKKVLSRLSIANEIFMAFLVFVSIVMLIFEETHAITPLEIQIIDSIDLTVALIFMAEFFIALYFAHNRRSFFRSHWWELLATIPFTSPATQAMRILRILRVVRTFRAGAHFSITKETIQKK